MTASGPSTPDGGRPIRVLLIDDDRLVAEMTEAVLVRAGCAVIGTASRLSGVPDLLDRGPADVALIDVRLPDGRGPTVIGRIHEAWPACACIVLTGFADAADLEEAIEAGADGVMLKEGGYAELVDLVTRAAAGDVLLHPSLLEHLGRGSEARPGTAPMVNVPAWEIAALQALVDLGSVDAMAQRLGVAPSTGRGYLRDAARTLGGERPVAVIWRALRMGLIRPPTAIGRRDLTGDR